MWNVSLKAAPGNSALNSYLPLCFISSEKWKNSGAKEAYF